MHLQKSCLQIFVDFNLQTVSGDEREEIASLQRRLESKIRIISPAIDMIELISARGNTSLDSAVGLTKAVRYDIQALGVRLSKAATEEDRLRRSSSNAKGQSQFKFELRGIIADIKSLLARIEDAVPLINLAITTSGVNLSTALPSTVSPSRLLQASTFLSAGDSQYAAAPGSSVQVGPAFVLSVYMLFAGHSNRVQDEASIRETTWKEVIHKARVKIMRVPLDQISDLPPALGNSADHYSNGANSGVDSDFPTTNVPSESKAYEFGYQLLVIEDLDDDRVHTFDDGDAQPGPYGGVSLAGIREVIPIHQVSKIFYADTGKILNIGADGEANNPVLLLKRDINAIPPRRMVDQQATQLSFGDEFSDEEEDGDTKIDLHENSNTVRVNHQDTGLADPWRLPQDLDPEWIAFEVYTETTDSDDEDTESLPQESPSPVTTPERRRANIDGPTQPLSNLSLQDDASRLHTSSSPHPRHQELSAQRGYAGSPASFDHPNSGTSAVPALRTSLSLLELLIRLAALQQFQQASHLTITDELLNFFLSESSSTGAGADSEYRKRIRRDTRRRVGFDPYAESPMRFHGEEHQRQSWAHEQDEQSFYEYESQYASDSFQTGRRDSPNTSGGTQAARRGIRNYPQSMPSSPSPSVRTSKDRKANFRASTQAQSPRSTPLSESTTPPRSKVTHQISVKSTMISSPLISGETHSSVDANPQTHGDGES